MENVLKELNKNNKEYVVMTKDRKCILRGKASTGYLLTTTNEKSRKKIRICCSTNELGVHYGTEVSDKVKELYNLKDNNITTDILKDLEFVKIVKKYEFKR